MASIMSSTTTSAFPSLQLQCLYSLVGRLEEYSSQTLSLLPASLRRQLLLLLPVVDICRLEQDPDFMSGLDADTIWRGLFDNRIVFYYVSVAKLLKQHTSAKDVYLSEVALCLLTSERSCIRYEFPVLEGGKCTPDVVAYMLFGIRLKNGDMPSMHMFSKVKSLGNTWLSPLRYSEELSCDDPLKIVDFVFKKFNCYPKRLDFSEQDKIEHPYNYALFKSIVPCVEAICLDNDDYTDEYFAESLEPLLFAIGHCKPSSLKYLSMSACVTNLGSLVSCVQNFLDVNTDFEYLSSSEEDPDVESENLTLAPDGNKFDHGPVYRLSGLKKIEILGNDGGTHPHEYGHTGYPAYDINSFIPFLDFQTGLESLIFEDFQSIVRISDGDEPRYVSEYDGFEEFYNYLPHFISKPSFKLLRVTRCTIPANSVKSMISTFLSNPTSHDQSLEFLECDITDRCNKTYSKEFPLLIQTNTPCVCGEHKSLSISLGQNPEFSEQWLFKYPNLRLKHLQLHYIIYGPQPFDAFSASNNIDFISCKFSHLGRGHAAEQRLDPGINELLKVSNLSEIELFCIYFNDDSVLSMFTNAFRQPLQLTSLKRLRLQRFQQKSEGLTLFFDALFSMPKEQLANFSLEVVEVYISPEEIYKSWKENGRNQKLRKFVYNVRQYHPYLPTGNSERPEKFETFPDMAVDSVIEL